MSAGINLRPATVAALGELQMQTLELQALLDDAKRRNAAQEAELTELRPSENKPADRMRPSPASDA